MSTEQVQQTAGSKLWKGFATIIFTAQVLASVILFVKAFLLGMIPDKYLYGMGIVLWLLLMVNALLLFVGMKRPGSAGRFLRRFAGILLTIFICFACVIGYQAMDKVKSTVKNVTAEQTGSDDAAVAVMNLYVVTTNPAKTAADCREYTIGTAAGSEAGNSKAALNKMSAETGIAVRSKEFASEEELISALYNGEVKAIIINATKADILSETEDYQSFVHMAKLIKEYDITAKDLAYISADQSNATENAMADSDSGLTGNITKTPFILYISGSDTRNKQFKTSRSDVNILMVVNPNTKQILLLNTPRDYYIPNPKSATGEKDKLTHLGLYGVGCSIKGLNNLYGCNINYSVQINFTGLVTLVDQLGGITVDNPQAFTREGYKYQKGKITMNGEQALGYCRERYAFSAGDNMRGQNQMRVITAIISKVTSSKSQVLKNYAGIMNSLSGLFRTSVPTSDIEKLVKMQLNDMAEWKVTSFAVTGSNGSEKTYSSPSHKAYVMWPNEKSVAEGSAKIRKVLNGEPL